MRNQALAICVNKYIFIINIYTHIYKYKCSNYKLLNITASENINKCNNNNNSNNNYNNNDNDQKQQK